MRINVRWLLRNRMPLRSVAIVTALSLGWTTAALAQCTGGAGGGGAGGGAPPTGGGTLAQGGAAATGAGLNLAQMQQLAALAGQAQLQQQQMVFRRQQALWQQQQAMARPTATVSRSRPPRPNLYLEASRRRREATLRLNRMKYDDLPVVSIAMATE